MNTLTAEQIQNAALERYCTPYGKRNPETGAFEAGANWALKEYALAHQPEPVKPITAFDIEQIVEQNCNQSSREAHFNAANQIFGLLQNRIAEPVKSEGEAVELLKTLVQDEMFEDLSYQTKVQIREFLASPSRKGQAGEDEKR